MKKQDHQGVSFSHHFEEVENALEKLDKEGIKNLVLDLQNNSGGYLNAAVDVVDQFFGDGLLVTYTKEIKADEKIIQPPKRKIQKETSWSSQSVFSKR